MTPDPLAAFDRILAESERNIAESAAFLQTKRAQRQIARSGIGWAPLAITISAADVRTLRAIREAIGSDA